MVNTEIKQELSEKIKSLKLPRYCEIPNVGLYLEQVTKFINGALSSAYCAEITTSMISNYVKKGFIPPPQKKQYDADQIAYLIFITLTKSVLSMEDIVEIFEMQKESYTLPMAYDYFCCELENMLSFVFGVTEDYQKDLGVTHTEEKEFLKRVIISVSHSMYLSAYFSEIKKTKPNTQT